MQVTVRTARCDSCSRTMWPSTATMAAPLAPAYGDSDGAGHHRDARSRTRPRHGASRTAASVSARCRGRTFEKVGGDELLFLDGRSRQQPFLCLLTAPAATVGLRIRGNLVTSSTPAPQTLAAGSDAGTVPGDAHSGSAARLQLRRLGIAEIVPWFAQNAWVHYLSPRGLEQYSGGGWGTRDVCQGPVEMLLALDRVAPIRDLLLRVMSQQNPDGDWPQWFMFFERERGIRPGDSHGDIVFWPLLVLAQYLIASGDAGCWMSRCGSSIRPDRTPGEHATVWQHVQRALDLIEASASSPARRWPPTATAIGTTRCSPRTRTCASSCAAPGR